MIVFQNPKRYRDVIVLVLSFMTNSYRGQFDSVPDKQN